MSGTGEKLSIHRIFDQEENEMETIEIQLPDYLAQKLPQEESVIQRVLELGLKQLEIEKGSETVYHEVVTAGLSIGAEDAEVLDRFCRSNQIMIFPSKEIKEVSLTRLWPFLRIRYRH